MSIALPYPEKIHYSHSLSIKDNVSVMEYGDSYVQTIEHGLNAQREEWDITWPFLTQSELATLLAALDSARTSTTMLWTNPVYNVQKKYRAVPNSRKIDAVAKDSWKVTMTIRQVFEP